MNENKLLKMTVENYNNIVKSLNELQLSPGIKNATILAQVGQLLGQVEILEEKENKKESGE